MKRLLLLMIASVLLISVCGSVSVQAQSVYAIDSAKSKIEIQVAKDGFLKAFGHDHLVVPNNFLGEIRLDAAKIENSSVTFSVDANSLKVMDPGESEKDRAEVQSTMLGERVLDAVRFPKIEFRSSAVKVSSASSDKWELQVSGMLTLHGVQKPLVLSVRMQKLPDSSLACDLEVPLLQSDFGITPYKAAGGAVRVKDKLKLTFHLIAAPQSAH